MKEILGKIFESKPETSIILLREKCSDCGRDVTIKITPTSGGFGLQDGVLLKYLADGYLAKCLDCYQTAPKFDGN